MPTFRSPAKLNLFLHVLGKRPDGFHELASLFQAVNLFDFIEIHLAEADQFSCSDESLPLDQSNLVLKALNLFRQKSKKNFSVKIDLQKRIPTQAGLGGGSGNAATMLFALNQLTQHGASDQELSAWSQEIGSDIPFFFSHGTAYCTGRGEKVLDLPRLPETPLYLFKPPQGLSTPKVFANLNLPALEKRKPETLLQACYDSAPLYFNDLEAPAFSLLPELADLKLALLNSGFHTVQMSGTGTAFFCLGRPKDALPEHLLSSSLGYHNRAPGSWY